MKRTISIFFAIFAFTLTNCLSADIRQGLVSYWPLDSVDLSQNFTVDVVAGNNMQLFDIFDTNVLTAGKFGQAFAFDAAQSQVCYFTGDTAVDTGLPITRNPAYTVSLWIKATGAGQSDLRYFCESSVADANNNPLYALGTQIAGTNASSRIYLRNSTGGVLVDTTTTNAVLDGTWHHVAMTYDSAAKFTFYVDGQASYTNTYTRDAAGVWDTTAIGGIVRAAMGNFFTGSVDDLAVWARALSQAEVQNVMANSIQTPVPQFAPAFSVNPKGSTTLLEGDAISLSAGVYGSRPMTYQWVKNGTNLAGASNPTLALSNLTTGDSGNYALVAINAQGSSTSSIANLVINGFAAPNLTNGLVAFWPLDTVIGTKTPDLVNGYDMTLVNMTEAGNLVPGRWGKAMSFTNATHTLLQRIDNPGEDLPIYNKSEFTLSMWVNGDADQADRRIFSEGSTASNNQLFNLGTPHTGVGGTVDSYIRTDTGATGDHNYSTATVFDDTWHNIVYVQRTSGTAINAVIYVDGVLDPVVLAPMRPLTMNNTTIGGILRSSASSWYSGLIDEVALWSRPLSPDEIQLLQTSTITNPPSHLQPLSITGFKADLPAVAAGGFTILRWDVSKDAGKVTISPSLGDVTAKTLVGVGSSNVTLTASTTFVLTITRGLDTLSATTSVAVVSGVAPGWVLLDNFDTYPAGPLSATQWWLDLRGNSVQIAASGSNKVMTTLATDSDAILDLHANTVAELQSSTLFFRMTLPVPTDTFPLHLVGLTDKNPRSYTDLVATTGGAVAGGFGPAAYPSVVADPNSGTNAWFLGARNGIGGTMDYSQAPLLPGVVYNVWLEITNAPMEDPDFQSDVFSVYLQKDGDATREKVFDSYLSDRDPSFVDVIIGGMQPNLDKLVVAGDDAAISGSFDDFYLSQGFNATIPKASGNAGGPLPALTIGWSGNQLQIAWSAGTLQQAPAASGPWTNVGVAAVSPYVVTPTATQQYYRSSQ